MKILMTNSILSSVAEVIHSYQDQFFGIYKSYFLKNYFLFKELIEWKSQILKKLA